MKRLLVLSSTDSGDAKSISDLILVELTKAGVISSKILSQINDGASVMAGHVEEFNVCCRNEKAEEFLVCTA